MKCVTQYLIRENLDTKLQVLRLPKTFRVAVYNRECTLFKAVNLITIIRIFATSQRAGFKAENNNV